jgi:hypothetical protein
MYISLQVKCPYYCLILMKLEFSRQIFQKFSDVNVHAYPSSESRVVPCGRKGGQTDSHDEANSRTCLKHIATAFFLK